MTMPADAPAWLRDILIELARAQARSEDRFAAVEAQLARLAAAQECSDAQLATLTASTERRFAAVEARLDRLDALLAQHSERLDRIDALLVQQGELLAQHSERLDRHGDQLGRLEGWMWETRVRGRAPSYRADVADRVQVLTPLERDRLLDPAVRDGRLTRAEARTVRLADFVARGADPESDAPRLLVAEISARVNVRDVERAAERAAVPARLGTPALGVVVGQRIDREAQTAADASGVQLIRAGAPDR